MVTTLDNTVLDALVTETKQTVAQPFGRTALCPSHFLREGMSRGSQQPVFPGMTL